MKTFHEAKLEVVFDDTWECEKWDECPSFQSGIKKLQGSDAVDFVGVRAGTIYFIEVKDFRSYRIENRGKHEKELPQKISEKVRDTIAGLVGASIMRKDDEFSRVCAQLIGQARDATKVRVIAWILEDKQLNRKDRVRAGVRRKQLVSQLRWLTTKVHDTNPLDNPRVDGVIVRQREVAS